MDLGPLWWWRHGSPAAGRASPAAEAKKEDKVGEKEVSADVGYQVRCSPMLQ